MAKSLHTPTYEQFCGMMASLRENAGLTQVDISLRLNRPQSFVSKYECGERRLDVVEFLEVCEALEVDPGNVIAQFREKIGK